VAARQQHHLPAPPRERWTVLAALAAGLAGLVMLGVAIVSLAGDDGTPRAAVPAPPPVTIVVPAPQPSPAAAAAPAPSPRRDTLDERRFAANDRQHVRATWVAGFYTLYERAAEATGVTWLLLASVHKQETGFSTHPTTYHGLNSAGCCAGPMQFNVTNRLGGAGSTWDRYRKAGAALDRPASYPHATGSHPSPYDDFDAITAAAALLRDGGAGAQLDGAGWRAAYDYYGHDLTGVDYADQVLARAIGWGRHGFCINCEIDAGTLAAVDGAWGAPVRAELAAAEAAAQRDRERQARANEHGPAARRRGG
jgi:hypothetical protein